MIVMGSPFVPGINSIYGNNLSDAREIAQSVAPVIAILVAVGFFNRTQKTGSAKNIRGAM